ncbi:MAG: YlcI/YnfO family protein [Burkholderiaceae bacterium]
MKTATLPSLRVAPALRSAAEAVLQAGESLSSFVEQAVRASVAERQMQHEFVARGLVARDAGRASQVYVSAGDVLQQLEAKLQNAEQAALAAKTSSTSL